jgi:hypothetical protein
MLARGVVEPLRVVIGEVVIGVGVDVVVEVVRCMIDGIMINVVAKRRDNIVGRLLGWRVVVFIMVEVGIRRKSVAFVNRYHSMYSGTT